jgi:hypothetical protein
MVSKAIWLPSIIDFLHDESEKAIESMTPTPKVPTVGTN